MVTCSLNVWASRFTLVPFLQIFYAFKLSPHARYPFFSTDSATLEVWLSHFCQLTKVLKLPGTQNTRKTTQALAFFIESMETCKFDRLNLNNSQFVKVLWTCFLWFADINEILFESPTSALSTGFHSLSLHDIFKKKNDVTIRPVNWFQRVWYSLSSDLEWRLNCLRWTLMWF